MRIKQVGEEVYYPDEAIVKLRHHDIAALQEQAKKNMRQRTRLCAHQNIDDKLHEMFIVHARGAYIRPHKHLGKSEAFHLIEGTVDVVIFDELGDIVEVIRMGEFASGHYFYFRISHSHYHTLLIRSEVLVFHEITSGPFRKSDTIFAPWSPDESDLAAVTAFMQRLQLTVEKFRK